MPLPNPGLPSLHRPLDPGAPTRDHPFGRAPDSYGGGLPDRSLSG